MAVSELVSLDLVIVSPVRSWVQAHRMGRRVPRRRALQNTSSKCSLTRRYCSAERLPSFAAAWKARLPNEQHAQCVASTTLKKSQGSTPHDHDLRFQMGS